MAASSGNAGNNDFVSQKVDQLEKLGKQDVDGDSAAHKAMGEVFDSLRDNPNRYAIFDQLEQRSKKLFTTDPNFQIRDYDAHPHMAVITPSYWDLHAAHDMDTFLVSAPYAPNVDPQRQLFDLGELNRSHQDLAQQDRNWLYTVETGLVGGDFDSIQQSMKSVNQEKVKQLLPYLQADMAASGLTFSAENSSGKNSGLDVQVENLDVSFNNSNSSPIIKDQSATKPSASGGLSDQAKADFLARLTQSNLANREDMR